MKRDEHLQWAKDRAIELLEQGDRAGAIASMMSDLRKHPELADHLGLELGALQLVNGHLNTDQKVRHWVTGFN